MIQLTAPLTKRQLVLLQNRKSLEKRLTAPTAFDYGLSTRIEQLDHELNQIEIAKHQEVTR